MLGYTLNRKGRKIAREITGLLGSIIGITGRWFLQGLGAGLGVLLAAKLLGVV